MSYHDPFTELGYTLGKAGLAFLLGYYLIRLLYTLARSL